MDVVQLENYSALLKTRLTGERRTSAILGVLLLLAALASTAASLLSEEPGRSLVIPWVVTFALGFGYLEARVRLQITRATAELVETLKRSASL